MRWLRSGMAAEIRKIQIFFLVFGVCCSAIYCYQGRSVRCGLVQKPGSVRITRGDDATFSWITNSSIREYVGIAFNFGGLDILEILNSETQDIREAYRAKLSAVLTYDTLNITLVKVGPEDTVHDYMIEFIHEIGERCQDYSSIFIYGYPTAPRCHVQPSGRINEGDNVTITCESESTSIPIRHRLPIVYTWTVLGKSVAEIDRYSLSGNENYSLSMSNVAKDTENTIICHAAEVGSPLANRKVLNLNFKDEHPGLTEKSAWIIGVSVALAASLVSAIGLYVCWKRKAVTASMTPKYSVACVVTMTTDAVTEVAQTAATNNEQCYSRIACSGVYDEIKELKVYTPINAARSTPESSIGRTHVTIEKRGKGDEESSGTHTHIRRLPSLPAGTQFGPVVEGDYLLPLNQRK